jgi:heparin/heparan-sulfate lyase
MHFFGQSHAQEAAIAHYLRRRMVEAGAGPAEGVYPVFRFLMTNHEKAPPPVLPAGFPLARYFASVGLVLMSSGFGPDDTYALFSQGGGVVGRRHDFDATHFSIYKKGYLALDTGTRFALPHSPNYRHQTVAHNCVLIHMPGERFPPSATGPVIANTAGQNRWPQEAQVLAFETNRHYAYTATDATPVYHASKCGHMVRQFIFLPPDHFVVFDRVISKRPDLTKTWLLHTANEPAIEGKEFRANQDQGRLFCRTLYPLDAVLEKIGGPGKEFWADGRNWPIVDRFQSPGSGDWWKHYGHGHTAPPEAMGRWRVEVKPGTARTEDVFLHLIQVSDLTTDKMVASQVRERGGQIELTFRDAARTYTIAFNKAGEVGGHIKIIDGDRLVVDRELTREIMPQSGLALRN